MKNLLHGGQTILVFLFRIAMLVCGPYFTFGPEHNWFLSLKIVAWCATVAMAFYLVRERLFLFGIILFLCSMVDGGFHPFKGSLSSELVVFLLAVSGCCTCIYALLHGPDEIEQDGPGLLFWWPELN